MGELDLNIKVLFEDNHIIVVEKPYGILSQEDRSGDIDMLTYLQEYLREKYKKPGNVFVGLLHRLDRNVGGVMVFAKTSKAASRISEQIRERTFKKTYLAIVEKEVKAVEKEVKNFLVKDEQRNKVKVFDKKVSNSKEAVLNFRKVTTKNNLSLLRIFLKTGRSHQIRAQLANLGHPIVGDDKYGDSSLNHIALWANQIKFTHPISKKEMVFNSKPELIAPWIEFKDSI